MALHYHSTLLAYLAVVCGYATLGFSVACFGLCWCIGFNSEEGIERCLGASGLTLLAVLVRPGMQLGPFASPITVFGGIVGFLALLIVSSKWYGNVGEVKYM